MNPKIENRHDTAENSPSLPVSPTAAGTTEHKSVTPVTNSAQRDDFTAQQHGPDRGRFSTGVCWVEHTQRWRMMEIAPGDDAFRSRRPDVAVE